MAYSANIKWQVAALRRHTLSWREGECSLEASKVVKGVLVSDLTTFAQPQVVVVVHIKVQFGNI